MTTTYLYEDLTEKIIKCFFKVYDELGAGFLESVYEKSLMIELANAGIKAENQKSVRVKYRSETVGEFIADIIADDKVIIEIKAVSKINTQHEAQLLNYLKATCIKVGLLVNFGEKLEFKRRVY